MSTALPAAGPLSALTSLSGRVALVVGGSGGIGAAIVELLLAAGATVVSADLPGRAAPPGAEAASVDLADPAQVRALVEGVKQRHGRLHVLVHAAGITRDGMLWKLEDAAWDQVLAVNLDSAFHLLKAAAPLLRAGEGGAVVLIASINGQRGKLGQANYAASKAGLIALGKTAAIELAASGVRVNTVAPGLIDTPMTAALPPEARRRATEESLLKRAGTPDDVARAVLFLATDMSRHVTGQVLRVDGGQLTA